MLAANDSQVRDFNKQLADVSKMLADERGDLGAALNELATALGQVQGFIKDNREVLKSNVDKLASITQVLVNQRAALAETLDVAPLALGNLQNSYNAASGTLDTRANINELNQPPIVPARRPKRRSGHHAGRCSSRGLRLPLGQSAAAWRWRTAAALTRFWHVGEPKRRRAFLDWSRYARPQSGAAHRPIRCASPMPIR